MFYDEKYIRDLLQCHACKSTLVAPKLLPCCQKTVCSACVDEMRRRQQHSQPHCGGEALCAFSCSLCSREVRADQPIVDNVTVQQLLSVQPKAVSRGKAFEQLQASLARLDAQIVQMETALPLGEEKIREHCHSVRNQVDTAFEQAAQTIQEHRLRMIADVDRYEAETLYKLSASSTLHSREMDQYKALVAQSRQQLTQWSASLSSNVSVSDTVTESLTGDCMSLCDKAAHGLRWFNNATFAHRYLRFNRNANQLSSDAVGSLTHYPAFESRKRIDKVYCTKTFERLQCDSDFYFVFDYVWSHVSDISDYTRDKLAVIRLFSHSIFIWSIGRNELVGELVGHEAYARKTRYLGNDRLLSCSDDRTLKLWDLKTFTCIRTYACHTSAVTYVTLLLLDDNATFASSSGDMTIRLWHVDNAVSVHALRGHEHIVMCVKAWRKSSQLVSFDKGNIVKIWCLESRTCLRTHALSEPVIWMSLFGDNDERAAFSFENFAIEIWNLDKLELISTLKGHTDNIFCMKKLPGEFLVSGSSDATIRVWNLETAQCVFTTDEHKTLVFFLRIFNNYSFMSCGADKCTKIWQIQYSSDSKLCQDTKKISKLDSKLFY